MAPTHLDVVKWADFIVNEERQDPDHGYSHEKPQRSPEEPLSGRLLKLLAVNGLESRHPDEQADSEKDQRDQQRGQPVAVMELRHTSNLDCCRSVAARSRDTTRSRCSQASLRGGGASSQAAHAPPKCRFNRNGAMLWRVAPRVTRSAMTSPITLQNLKPCPENPAAIATRGVSGCISRMKCSSGLFVNMQVFAAMVAPFALGKKRLIPSRRSSSSALSTSRLNSSGSPC